MHRFFYNTYQNKALSQYPKGEGFALTDDIHHHWCRVLRAKHQDKAILFDGFGGEYQVELIEIQKKTSHVQILAYDPVDRIPSLVTEIGLVMSRGDRMDYAIQKATEMGVTAIQLLTSHHGEVRLKPAQVAKKLAHWQQVAISACEQCAMNRVPIVLPPVAIQQWLTNPQQFSESITKIKSIEACEFIQPIITEHFYQALLQPADISLVLAVPKNNASPTPATLKSILNKSASEKSMLNRNKPPFVRLLIGAEGGLSMEEIKTATDMGFQAWQIGERVLRTETAPVVALSVLNTLMATY